MPANAGTAYVQIVPSAKGIKGNITDALKNHRRPENHPDLQLALL